MKSLSEEVRQGSQWTAFYHQEWEEWKKWQRARNDPERVFSERQDWPKYITGDRARDTTERWAADHGLGIVDWYAASWPLPVGREALFSEREYWKRPSGGHDVNGSLAMPFEADEWAAWIFTTRCGMACVECFGLATPQADAEDGVRYFTVGPAAFRITCTGTPPDGVTKLCQNIADWWGQIGGQLFGRGRPPGTQTYTQTEYVQRIREYVALHGPNVKRDQFLEDVGPSLSTFRRWAKKWGTDWPSMLKEACRNL